MRTSSIPPVGRKDQEAFDSRPKTPDGSTNDSPVSALYQMQVYTHTDHHRRRRRPTILHQLTVAACVAAVAAAATATTTTTTTRWRWLRRERAPWRT
jgi:hypothetical protein